MNPWITALFWVGIYIASIRVVPTEKLCTGIVTKYVLKRIIPPKRFWRTGLGGHQYRYWLWLIAVQIIVQFYPKTKGNIWNAVFFIPIIALLLDDYFFGDDNWKKLWEGGKNKIKWLMELPPEPARQRETA